MACSCVADRHPGVRPSRHTFEGDDYAIITVIPARAGKYPEMLLYAGTATSAVAEINSPSVARVDAPIVIVIADAFGPLMVGSWEITSDGTEGSRRGSFAN